MKRIGIVGSRDWFKTIANYYEAVEACGALTVPVTSVKDEEEIDGLIIPGGADVDPALYGEENVACLGIDRALDDLEMELIDYAVKRSVPILGICRGHQILNVYFGGSLIQDIRQADRHRHTDTGDAVHDSIAEESSFLEEIYGKLHFPVNSAHHQAVNVPGKGLHVAQRSDDGVIEAICHEALPVYGVQWHPERMCLKHSRQDTVDGLDIFRWFTDKIAGRYPV